MRHSQRGSMQKMSCPTNVAKVDEKQPQTTTEKVCHHVDRATGEDLAARGEPVYCLEKPNLWAVPVRFRGECWYVALCIPTKGVLSYVSMPDAVNAILQHTDQKPRLQLGDDNQLEVSLYDDHGTLRTVSF